MADVIAELFVLRVWNVFRAELTRVVQETQQALGAHLGEAPLELRELGCERGHLVAEIVTRHGRVVVECPIALPPPSAEETRLADVFDADRGLVRIVARRATLGGPPSVHPSAWLACDPRTGRWVSSEADLPPARLDDPRALDPFLFTLLTDACR